MLKNHSIASSSTSLSAVSISSSSSSVTKYIASPARIASRVFGWPSTTRSPSAIPSIVRSPPVASSITSRSGPPSFGSSSTASSSRIATEPGPLVQQLVRAVDGRVEDAEAAGAGGEDGLEADRAVGVAELLGRSRDLGGAVDASEVGPLDAEPLQQGVGLRLVVGAVDRVRRRDQHRHGEAVPVRGEPFEVEGRLRQDDVDSLALDDVQHRVGEAGVGAGGDEVEGIGEVPADRAPAHVGADDADAALAVRAQALQQRGRPGRAGRADEDGDVLQERSILSAASWSRRRSFSSSSIARIVSPMRVPG